MKVKPGCFHITRKLSHVFVSLCLVFFSYASVSAQEADARFHVLAFGDSLTAGYGLGPGAGFTEQLEAWLSNEMDAPVKVVNGGVSGDTSSGGRARLDWALAAFEGGRPDLVILELGANDGLRGVDPTVTRDNIDAMVASLKAKDIPVLVAGMVAPPNLGQDYADVFNPIFQNVAEKYSVALYSFFLDGVAADQSLNQSDGIHPNEEGVKIIVGRIGPMVKQALMR